MSRRLQDNLMAFAFLAVSWLLVAVGMRRQA